MQICRKLCSVFFFQLAFYTCLHSANAADKATWDGPRTGPKAHHEPTEVEFVAQDLRNGGIVGVYRAFEMAAKRLGWHVTVRDGQGRVELVQSAFETAIRNHPAAIIVGGFDVAEMGPLLPLARKNGVVLIGWHAGATPGPSENLYTNVTTDPLDVAQMSADYVVRSSHGNVGVVLINDSRFRIANAKTKRMQEIVNSCANCRILSVEDIAISDAAQKVGAMVDRLNTQYGEQWTHTIAINDVYFDEINFPLIHNKRSDIKNISAGDGSNKAISRIRSGLSQQTATIAEPINVQGWQLADEINRGLSGQAPSLYVSKPILVTTESLRKAGDKDIDADIPYEAAYMAIWEPRIAR